MSCLNFLSILKFCIVYFELSGSPSVHQIDISFPNIISQVIYSVPPLRQNRPLFPLHYWKRQNIIFNKACIRRDSWDPSVRRVKPNTRWSGKPNRNRYLYSPSSLLKWWSILTKETDIQFRALPSGIATPSRVSSPMPQVVERFFLCFLVSAGPGTRASTSIQIRTAPHCSSRFVSGQFSLLLLTNVDSACVAMGKLPLRLRLTFTAPWGAPCLPKFFLQDDRGSDGGLIVAWRRRPQAGRILCLCGR